MPSYQVERKRRSSGRDILLAAADRLFTSMGYGRVSVATVLAESGLKAPSLYHHFGDKQGLYLAWADHSLTRLGNRLRDSLATVQDFGTALQMIADCLTSPAFPDILEIHREFALLRPEGVRVVEELLETHVYSPVELWLAPRVANRAGLSAFARYTVHFAAAGRIDYLGANTVVTPVDWIRQAAHLGSGLADRPHGMGHATNGVHSS